MRWIKRRADLPVCQNWERLLWDARTSIIDYLGTAAPHGAYWLPFFLTFTALP